MDVSDESQDLRRRLTTREQTPEAVIKLINQGKGGGGPSKGKGREGGAGFSKRRKMTDVLGGGDRVIMRISGNSPV